MALVEINWQPTRRDLRIFGIALAVFCAVIAWLLDRESESGRLALGASLASAVLLLITVLVVALVLFAPQVLRPVYFGFTVAAFPIGWVVSHVLLAVVFYGVFTPIGLFMRLIGRDPMHRRFDPDTDSYWVPRKSEKSLEDYFRQS